MQLKNVNLTFFAENGLRFFMTYDFQSLGNIGKCCATAINCTSFNYIALQIYIYILLHKVKIIK